MKLSSTVAVLALFVTGCAADQPRFDRPFRAGPGGLGPDGRTGPGGGPGWLFISPMGEPFRMPHPEKAWFAGADVNHDGRIDRTEFTADADRFFAVLDRGGDGEIDPDDIDVYENRIAPEIRVGGSPSAGPRRDGPGRGGRGSNRGHGGGGPRGAGGPGGGGPSGGGPGGGNGGPGGDFDQGGGKSTARQLTTGERQGAARYGYLDLPEPVTPADTNFNRGVDRAEFERAADDRFALLDKNHDGMLTDGELPPIDTRTRRGRGRERPGIPPSPPPSRSPQDAEDSYGDAS